MKHEILSWAYGFFTPIVFILTMCLAFSIIGWWMSMPEKLKWLDTGAAWAGGFLLVSICIIVIIVIWRFTEG